jgi:hypothetical protein
VIKEASRRGVAVSKHCHLDYRCIPFGGAPLAAARAVAARESRKLHRQRWSGEDHQGSSEQELIGCGATPRPTRRLDGWYERSQPSRRRLRAKTGLPARGRILVLKTRIG